MSIIGVPLDLGQSRRGVDMGPSAIRYAGLEERLREIGLRAFATAATSRRRAGGARRSWTSGRGTCRRSWRRRARLAAVVARGGRRGLAAARPRRRPLDRDGDARRPRARGRTAGRRHLDRRARRPQHARDEPVGKRARDAARGRARPLRRRGSRTTAWCSRPSTRPRGAGRHPLARRGGAGASCAARGPRVHDERDRPDRHRAGDAGRRSTERGRARASSTSRSISTRSTPRSRPASGTPVRGGLTYREAHLALRARRGVGLVGSLEVVEANPILDRENTTALTAVELVASALGKTIL